MKKENRITKTRVGLALPVALLMAANGWGYVTAHYIDENGRPAQNTTCTLINASLLNTVTFNNSASCLVVDDTLEFNGHFYLTASDVTFIISDKAKLTINYNSSDNNTHAMDVLHNIKIFGQKNQAGSLIVNETGSNYSRGLSVAGTLQIYGGHVTVTSNARDAIWANGDIDIYGGYISATSNVSGYNGVKSETGNINVNWANSLYANSYSGNVNIASGLTLNGSDGNTYSGSNTPAGGVTLTPDYLTQLVTNENGSKRVVIDGEYTGIEPVSIPSADGVVAIDYNRTFRAGIASTVVLPFQVPQNTTLNAKYYALESVDQEGCSWTAIMQYIGDGNVPTANTPYAVLLKKGVTDGKLTFDLNGGTASVGTVSDPRTTTNGGNWHFIGTYSFKEWKTPADGLGLAYAFAGSDNPSGAAAGEFGKLAIDLAEPNKYPSAKPFRAYLQKDNENVKLVCSNGRPAAPGETAIVSGIPETIDVIFIDEDENGEHTTFMARMNTRTGEFQMKRNYDLKGRKINNAPKARGAYYGKKVLKK